MKCRILLEKSGIIFTYGILENNSKVKVLDGHLFYGKTVDVEPYKNDYYIVKNLNYDENEVLAKYTDNDGLVYIEALKEVKYVSKEFKRVYEIENYWFFIPKPLIEVVEYLYKNNLIKESKIRLTKKHTLISGSVPIYNVNYDKIFEKVIIENKAITAHYYCDKEKDFNKGVYADFYVLGNLNEGKFQLQFWEIIGNGNELYYSHFIKNIDEDTFNHFDLATHFLNENSNIEDLLQRKKKIDIRKFKWFRNDNNFTKEQIFDITKIFFRLENLIDEFNCKKY